MLQDLIEIYEKLKENIYIIKRGEKIPLIIKFKDENFFHLVGLHKTNINMFIPSYITTKSKKYKYIKKHVNKFNNILKSEIKGNTSLTNRIKTFYYILDLIKGLNTTLYNLQPKMAGSLYDGDYGLLKIYEEINCLLGLVVFDIDNKFINCAPQSWMASNKVNHLIEFKNPIYMYEIISIPKKMFDEANNLVSIN